MATMYEREEIRQRLYGSKKSNYRQIPNTGKPAITHHPIHDDTFFLQTDVYDRLIARDKKIIQKLNNLQNKIAQEETEKQNQILAECKFCPNINQKSQQLASKLSNDPEQWNKDVVERLYQRDNDINFRINKQREDQEKEELDKLEEIRRQKYFNKDYDNSIFEPFIEIKEKEFYQRLNQEEDNLLQQLNQIGGTIKQGVNLYEEIKNDLYQQCRLNAKAQTKIQDVYVENQLQPISEQLAQSKMQISQTFAQQQGVQK